MGYNSGIKVFIFLFITKEKPTYCIIFLNNLYLYREFECKKMRFDELDLEDAVLDGLYDMNFDETTPVQELTIPVILEGKDIIACAQTGTGKTAAYVLPVINELSKGCHPTDAVNAVIMAPTRELAQQIDQQIQGFTYFIPSVSAVAVYGGTDGIAWEQQKRGLEMGADIVIATPGRLLSHIKLGSVDLSKVSFFVLDEADRMLDMGFIHDIKRILPLLPKKRQSLFFSATMPPEIERLAGTILSEPQKVEVTPASSTVDAIDQSVYFVEKAEKINLLKSLLENPELESVLIFTRTKHGADKVARVLSKAEIGAEAIHGNKSQTARQRALTNFKDHTTRVLIATDIAARGIDVDHLTHVINYELPNVPETYVHRIGRTGRAGREGVAFSFCDAEEVPLLKDIQKLIGKEVPVAGGHMYETKEVKAAVAEKKEAIKQESKRRNMFGSKRDGSYWRNKKRAANSSK